MKQMDANHMRPVNRSGWKYIIKAVLFFLVLVMLLVTVSRVMTVDLSGFHYHMVRGVFEEPPNTLDGIYIGSSNSFYYWNSMAAFGQYGITVMPLGSNSQPITAAEGLIRQARKTQPDALYIVNINSSHRDNFSEMSLHKLLDYLPFSWEKLRLTGRLMELAELPPEERLEYYFPLIRYHSRWDEITPGFFVDLAEDYKNGFDRDVYFAAGEDFSDRYHKDSTVGEVRPEAATCFESLLDYCDEENVKILFVTVPQVREKEIIQLYNGINAYITSRGYPVLNLLENVEKTGISSAVDFQNTSHTNVHGSLKFTHYVSRYLIENYGFTDKRGDVDYTSWQTALDKYIPMLAQYTLDFEIQKEIPRDYTLAQVEHLSAEAEGGSVLVSWDGSSAQEGFAVYRKAAGIWEQVQRTDAYAFIDTHVEEGVTYTYTVVPCRESGGEVYYGNFPYNGVSVTA